MEFADGIDALQTIERSEGSVHVVAPESVTGPVALPVTLLVSTLPSVVAIPGELEFRHRTSTPSPPKKEVRLLGAST